MAVRNQDLGLWPDHRLAPSATDDELLARFVAARDEAAFEALVRRHGPLVYGVCRRILSDAATAEDAFQATFLILLRRAGGLRGGRLGPWLYGVARRVALRARARGRRTGTAVVPEPAVHDPCPAVWIEVRAILDDEVGRLPARYRVPFILCYVEGLSLDRAAEALGSTRGTVASWLSRAKARLRDRLAGRGLAVSVTALAVGITRDARGLVPESLVAGTARLLIDRTARPAVVGLASVGEARWLRYAAVLLVVAAAGFGWWSARRPDPPPTEKVAPGPVAWSLVAQAVGPPGGVCGLAFADGDRLILSGLPRDRAALPGDPIRIWDSATGQMTSAGGAFGGAPIAVSPDGRTLAISDRELRLTDMRTGRGTTVLRGTGGAFVVFAPDGERVAVGDPRGPIQIWDASAGRVIGRRAGMNPGRTAAFTPDGRTLVTLGVSPAVAHQNPERQRRVSDDARPVADAPGSDGTDGTSAVMIDSWDLETDEVRSVGPIVAGPAAVMALSPDGTILAIAEDRGVSVWDAATGRKKHRLTTAGSPAARTVTAIAFGSEGQLITGSDDGSLRVWDLGRESAVADWPGHSDRVTALAVGAGGRIASAGRHGEVRVWGPRPTKSCGPAEPAGRVTIRGPQGIQALAIRPDGRAVAAAGMAGGVPYGEDAQAAARQSMAVGIWDVRTGRKWATLDRPPTDVPSNVPSLAYSPDGRQLAGATRGVTFWDPRTGAGRPGDEGPATMAVVYDAAGRRVVALRVGADAEVWGVTAARPIATLVGCRAGAAAFAADGETVVTADVAPGDGGPRVETWDARTGQHKDTVRLDGPVVAGRPTLSRDGRRLALPDHATGAVAIYDTATGRRVVTFPAARVAPGPYPMAFGPTGGRLIVGQPDGTVEVRATGTGTLLARLRGHRESVAAVAVSADGRVASAAVGGEIIVWEHRPAAETDRPPGVVE